MNIDNIKPNSNRYKEEQKEKEREKKVEKVVTGKVITKKPSKVRKFTNEFISEDARNVKSYIFGEVLIPAAKKALSDIVTEGIDIILYGESRRGSKRSTVDRVSYSSKYNDYSRSSRNERTTSEYDYDDIVLGTRGDAEEVLNRMDEIMDTYGMVSVADLKDLVGITGYYTDNKYGWTNIRNADVVRVRDGYMIRMPRVTTLD